MKSFVDKITDSKKILLIFLAAELINLLTLLVSNYLNPLTDLYKFGTGSWGIIRAYGNFDGYHYWNIAVNGYGLHQEAFFPLYPVIIRISGVFINSHFINGLMISNLSFLLFLLFLFKFLRDLIGEKKAMWTIFLLALFPTSFFFVSYYASSTFFLFFSLYLYLLTNKKYLFSGIFGYFSALTRFIGLFALIPAFIYLFSERKNITFKKLVVILGPIFGFLTYSFYLFKTKGDFLFFISAQPNFGANRSTDIVLIPQVIYRYIKIFLTFKGDITYFVAILEFSIFTVVLVVLLLQLYQLTKDLRKKRKDSLLMLVGLNIFSLVNLILPTLSGTFSSIPRYALISISFFIFIGSIKSTIIKMSIGSLFFILHIILFTLFLNGHFVG